MWILTQRILAAIALIAFLPLISVLALVIRLTSPGSPIHRATRITAGRPFAMLKLRTMVADANAMGLAVTAAGDPRITQIGRLLRATKLDELPQLLNVARGEMLLVGPRPEDPAFADWSNPLHQLVYRARPGITGPTALEFRNEETLLQRLALELAHSEQREPTAADIDRAYRERILPRKAEMDADYLRNRSFLGDLAVMFRTVREVVGRRPSD